MNVDVFVADVRRHDCEMRSVELSASCVHRLAKISHPLRRAQFILGRILLRHALRQQYGAAADSWQIDTTLGKPRLLGIGAPGISLSHSRHLVACAISQRAIGLDVEFCQVRDYVTLALQICTPLEIRQLRALPEAKQGSFFYRLWTRKEATYKLDGGNMDSACQPKRKYFLPGAGFSGAVVADSKTPLKLILHSPSLEKVVFVTG